MFFFNESYSEYSVSRRISENSDEYRTYMRDKSDSVPIAMRDNFFGKNVVQELDLLSDDPENTIIKEVKLQDSYNNLLSLLRRSDFNMQRAKNKFLGRCLKNDKLKEELILKLPDYFSSEINSNNLEKALLDNVFDTETYEKLLRTYVEDVTSREQKFLTEEWPRYKSEFTGSFQSIAEKYKLPINGDLIQQRLEEVKFSMLSS
jgi:hypothetical protein